MAEDIEVITKRISKGLREFSKETKDVNIPTDFQEEFYKNNPNATQDELLEAFKQYYFKILDKKFSDIFG